MSHLVLMDYMPFRLLSSGIRTPAVLCQTMPLAMTSGFRTDFTPSTWTSASLSVAGSSSCRTGQRFTLAVCQGTSSASKILPYQWGVGRFVVSAGR